MSDRIGLPFPFLRGCGLWGLVAESEARLIIYEQILPHVPLNVIFPEYQRHRRQATSAGVCSRVSAHARVGIR